MAVTRIISVANSKGGVGKSTVTMFLAVALATEQKKKVLILDTDNQKTITDFYELESDQHETTRVAVESVAPQRVPNYINRWGGDYDVIFIDIPRITARQAEANILGVLNYCDSVLIPVIGSQVDVLATLDFLEIMKGVKADRKEDGLKFQYYGFINRRSRRTENVMARNSLEDAGLKMFTHSLNDLKIFSNPSTVYSILERPEGVERFKPFYTEFIKRFKF